MNKPEFLNQGTKAPFSARYENFIGGQWVAPVSGRYFENTSPITGRVICEVARSEAADVDKALDAAHAAKEAWGRTLSTERARMLNRIADRMEDNLDLIALAETWDNGKPIRETTHADIPLAIDHWRYFAGCLRAQEGAISEIDHDTVAYHFHEPARRRLTREGDLGDAGGGGQRLAAFKAEAVDDVEHAGGQQVGD